MAYVTVSPPIRLAARKDRTRLRQGATYSAEYGIGDIIEIHSCYLAASANTSGTATYAHLSKFEDEPPLVRCFSTLTTRLPLSVTAVVVGRLINYRRSGP